MALSGDWQLLKERALTFLNDEKKARSDLKRIPDHEFYVGLADKNIKGMQEALDKLLELKFAKRAAKDTLLHFDFYLQPHKINQRLTHGELVIQSYAPQLRPSS